jgi:hypothetical protein
MANEYIEHTDGLEYVLSPPSVRIKYQAASTLLGRGSSGGTGKVEVITLGSGLTMTGTVLSSSGGGSGLSSAKVGARTVGSL